MLVRALVTVVALSVPAEAQAAGYVVQPGDTLGGIAERAHVSVSALAQANGIQQPNFLRAGQSLYIPLASGTVGYTSAQPYAYSPAQSAPGSVATTPTTPAATSYGAPSGAYTVQWGDTLSGLALRYHTSVDALRAANPTLGSYLIAGQSLNLCTTCASAAATAQGVAAPYSAPVPQAATPYAGQATVDSSSQARALIIAYAQQYGLDSSFPLAIATQESGFQQTAVSGAGAIGVMQVLPSTANQISALMGRPVNLYSLDDNIHSGVFWLAHLVNQYGGDERLAAAAYYQGSASLATHGYYDDTVRYVSGAMSLKTGYGG